MERTAANTLGYVGLSRTGMWSTVFAVGQSQSKPAGLLLLLGKGEVCFDKFANRPTNAAIPANGHIIARFAASASPRGATYVHTKLSMNSRSPTFASLRTVGNNSHNWATSRFVAYNMSVPQASINSVSDACCGDCHSRIKTSFTRLRSSA
jgi:hypothetical protein